VIMQTRLARAFSSLAKLLAVALLAAWGATAGFAAKRDKVEELVSLHDLKTSVAIGNYYLKQQALFAVREQLARLGEEEGLGADWNPSNPDWKEAEQTLMARASKELDRDFASLEWLSQEWSALNESDFSEEDIDQLLKHLKTDYGRKQVMIVDHGVAVHVQSALTFTGKMQYDVPGLEEDRNRMQHLFNEEDRDMRFNFADSPEGTQFAMSPIGKRYFVNAMLKVSGMISRRVDETAASIPYTVRGLAREAQPAVQAFRRKHAG
jgi:hypothetical protein